MKPKSMLLRYPARNRAVSLIEGVLYLVVALAVIAAGIVYFQQASLSRQVNETSKMMSSVSAYLVDRLKTASNTEADPSFGWDESPSIYAMSSGAVPVNMIDEMDYIIRHPWGGVIAFYEQSAEFNGSRTPLLVARINDVPEEVCLRLGHKNLGGDTPVGLDVLQISLEENDEFSIDNDLTMGEVYYSVGPNEETDFRQLAMECYDGVDMVIYYRVAMTPDTIPQLGEGDYGSGGGGFGGGGGSLCWNPILSMMEPCAPIPEDSCINEDGMPEPCGGIPMP